MSTEELSTLMGLLGLARSADSVNQPYSDIADKVNLGNN